MGLRYRKSVKILPGVRVNISKSGLSTTIGPKGASVNIGKKGVYANAGIPGTGVFMREKISGTKTNSQTKSSNKGSDPEFIRLFEAYEPISLKIDNTGKVVVLGKDNMVITDAFFLKILKTMDAYKTEKEQLVAAWKEKSEEVYQKARESISELINIHQYSFDVKPEEAYAQELAKIKKQEYQKQLFDEKEPTKQQVEASLASYADVHITTKAFWRVKKLRRQYVQENLEQQYQKQHSEWEKRKAEFDNKQQIIADSLNDSYEKEYMEKCETIKAAISGSEEYVKEHIEKWLANCSFPVEINVDYEYEVKTGDVYIDILLPTEEVIPTQEMIRLANGGVKEKAKPKTKMQEESGRKSPVLRRLQRVREHQYPEGV